MSVIISAVAILVTAASFYYQRQTALIQRRPARLATVGMVTCLILGILVLLFGIYVVAVTS